jgi:hypothetical protein
MEKQTGQNCKIAIVAPLIKQTLISKPFTFPRKNIDRMIFSFHMCAIKYRKGIKKICCSEMESGGIATAFQFFIFILGGFPLN